MTEFTKIKNFKEAFEIKSSLITDGVKIIPSLKYLTNYKPKVTSLVLKDNPPLPREIVLFNDPITKQPVIANIKVKKDSPWER